MLDELTQLQSFINSQPTVIVIGGMAKTGTTLPLSLLDGHPDLIVFPEELRFFHMKADQPDGKSAADRFLANENTQRLSKGRRDFGSDDYTSHGGTGFGVVDYSMFDWEVFERVVRAGFLAHRSAFHRFMVVIGAYLLGMNRPIPNGPTHIVSKAPHNERFAEKWVRMLGENGRFIQCTRDPIEHFLSLSNVEKIYGTTDQNPEDYVYTVRKRLRKWRHYPAKQLYVLNYDSITSDTDNVMRDIANFLGIDFHPTLLAPSKNGQPWSGNSSRQIVSQEVFSNPHIARGTLPIETQRYIEVGLQQFMTKMGWDLSSPVTNSERLHEVLARPRVAGRRFLRRNKGRFTRKT